MYYLTKSSQQLYKIGLCISPPLLRWWNWGSDSKGNYLTSHSLWEAEVGFAPGSLVPEPVLFTTISHTEYNYAAKIMYTEFYKSN